MWRESPPVSANVVEIVRCTWTPKTGHSHVTCEPEAVDYSGGFAGSFGGVGLELKPDVGMELEIVVRAGVQPWSGYLSYCGNIRGRQARAFGRIKASIGPFDFWATRWHCFKNQVRRIRGFLPRGAVPTNTPARLTPLSNLVLPQPERIAVSYEDLWFMPKGMGGDYPLAGVRELEIVNITDDDLPIDVEAVWARDGQELRVAGEGGAGKLTLPARGREVLTLRFTVSARDFNAKGRGWFLGADESLEIRDVSRNLELVRVLYSDAERFRGIMDKHGRIFKALEEASDEEIRQSGRDSEGPRSPEDESGHP